MICSFRDQATSDIFDGRNSAAARKACPISLWHIARRKLEQLDSVVTLEELSIPPGNRLERLVGDRTGQFSIRVNQRYRVCFEWTSEGPDRVQVVDYH